MAQFGGCLLARRLALPTTGLWLCVQKQREEQLIDSASDEKRLSSNHAVHGACVERSSDSTSSYVTWNPYSVTDSGRPTFFCVTMVSTEL